MATPLGKLKQKRAQIKGQVTRAFNYFEATENITQAVAQVRLKKLEEAFSRFEIVQDEIEDATAQDDVDAADADGTAERQLFEDQYYRTAAKAQAIIDSQQQRQIIPQNRNNQENHSVPRNRPKLPEIKLPEFNGEYTKWIFFKNSFETTIHQDPGLTAMQKHQYLIGVLQGEARSVIQGFQISNENYENAWTLLKETYDNKMMIIQTHLDELLEFPAITKEKKADSIRQFIWHIQTHISSLKTLEQPVEHWETIIIHLAKKKLDFIEQRDWQNLIKDRTPENMPKMTDFMKFLTDRCHTIRVLEQGKPKAPAGGNQMPKTNTRTDRAERRVSLSFTTTNCRICDGEHPIYKCEELLKLTASDRMKTILDKRLCINCLTPGHYVRDCRGMSCKKCDKKHNTLLHQDTENGATQDNGRRNPVVTHTWGTVEETEEEDSITMNVYCVQKPKSRVILSTAQVYIRDADGNQRPCRALLDPGSQLNLITANLVRKLNLKCTSENRPIFGVNQVETNSRKATQIEIKSVHGNFTTRMECLVLPAITEQLPQWKIDTTRIHVPKDAQLADPAYDTPGPIELLVGAGVYWKLLIGSPKNRVEGQPALQNTRLGLIIGGEIYNSDSNATTSCHLVTNTDLHRQMERFWAQEIVPETHPYSKEEKECEKYYNETVRRDQDGRFIIRLPLRPEVTLGDSKQRALERFLSLEKRMDRSPQLKNDYSQFMQDYLDLGHMSPFPSNGKEPPSEIYFIPHQPVIRPDSLTTKLRVVFDASAKTSLGTSLNDKLMPGPNLQQDLLKIAIRFRTHQFVLTADISMMFRQILVDPRDRRFQLILWRTDRNQPVQEFQLNTVTYGTNCAPFEAMRCLRELAKIHQSEFPRAAEVINEDSYMDDFLTGGPTLKYVVELQKELSELLMRGQFPLRKWRSNDPRAIQHLTAQNEADNLLIIDREEALKTLGLLWNATPDELQYQVAVPKRHSNTKRDVLSKIAQVYDPLGLVSPILITGKLIMQQLWKQEIDWDQGLPTELAAAWDSYYTSLPRINELKLSRNINPGNREDTFDLYGFGDASERAFGASFYAVSTDHWENVQAHLLCARTKVAPLKTVSLPRLELEAALLVSQLYDTIRTACGRRIGRVRLWSDSTITLGWIRTQPCLLKTFVANRVAKIQNLTEDAGWQHVPSEENPADLVSRGVSIDNLSKNDLWWHGPHWLKNDDPQPASRCEPAQDLPELKPERVALTVTDTPDILKRYSSYSKLCRIIAYCLRYRWNRADQKKTGPIDPEELEKAEKAIARLVQRETFSAEIRCLNEGRDLPRNSQLPALSPFLDEEGLIRVGGRLRHAEIAHCQKHPIVLPAKHHITTLIMRERHQQLLHCPPEQLLHDVRLRFWPISGRREARKVIKRCLKCFRFKPTTPDVLMGDMPAERVRGFARPFTITGIDYAGPLQLRESRRRGRVHVSKAYIAVFTCFSTKAVHLEIVTDLTTEAFLASLSRFTARRGICSKLFSDNGTNFVGASRELSEIYEFLTKQQPEIETYLAKQRIEWKFIPPRSPHFGGLWEAAVKMTKRHLHTVTQGRVLTYEEYNTLLIMIEAVLNSRPLTPLSSDPTDFTVLTPAHFLIGDSLLQPVQSDFLEVTDNRLSRWQHVQKLGQLFWERWQAEYLLALQRRNKWTETGIKVQLNDLVLLKEDHVPPLQWARGRVMEVHPGRDDEIRVVTVRTQSGSFKRSVKKLCLLPMEGSSTD